MAALALGTVQLGLPYGAANATGMPTEDEAVAMVTAAVAGGVTSLDTVGFGNMLREHELIMMMQRGHGIVHAYVDIMQTETARMLNKRASPFIHFHGCLSFGPRILRRAAALCAVACHASQ